MSKNVAVFVDVANIFYAAKAAGADIDYVTLLKAAVAGRDFVRAYAYTGLDPENENQRNFHAFLARHGYKVVSKDIRKYGDGKVKANLDIELVVDMMKTARNLDVAIVVSGDGDFAPAIRAVQEMGVRVEVISFRGNTSSDLIEAADVFYDITQLARVDRDSSRSGRRVSGDDEDLSMTEVPDKQTEGRGGRRGRGRSRGGRAEGVDEVAAAESRTARPAARGVSGRPAPRSGGHLVALPGEKLSRAAGGGNGEAPDEALPEESRAGLIEGEEVDVVEIVEGAERVPRAPRAPKVPSPPGVDAAGVAVAAGATAGRRPPTRSAKARRANPTRANRRLRRRRVPTSSGRSGTHRSAWPVDRSGSRRSPRTRTTTPSRRSPSTCSPSDAVAVDAEAAARAEAAAECGVPMPRPWTGSGTAVGRRRRAIRSPRASRSRSSRGGATIGRSASRNRSSTAVAS